MSPRSWTRTPSARPTTRRLRLAVETLEDRAVPAALVVNDAADNTTADGLLSLREAMKLAEFGGDANAALGRALTAGEAAQVSATPAFGTNDTITFAPALAGQTVTVADGWNGAGDDTALRKEGPSPLTIDGGPGVTLQLTAANRRIMIVGGETTLKNLTLTGGNHPPFGEGGAVWGAGGSTLEVENVRFVGNAANIGGAIRTEAVLRVRNSTFESNTATGGVGGAILLYPGAQAAISGSTFVGNTAAGDGGAIYVPAGAAAAVENSTFTDNLANDGSAVYNAGSLSATHATLVNNAVRAGRLGTIYTAGGATSTLANTLLYNNVGWDLQGPGTHTGDYNFTGDGSAPGANSIRNTNAQIGPLGDYGGPTPTIPLLPGSPAIAAALPDAALDQRGLPRNAAPDIGAFETQVPTVAVTVAGGAYTGSAYGVTDAAVTGLDGAVLATFGSPALAYRYYAGALSAAEAAAAAPLAGAPVDPGTYTAVAVYTSDAAGYRDAVSPPATFTVTPAGSVQGLVYVDFNNDGQVDFGEQGVGGVTVTLTGTDDLGNAVSQTAETDDQGVYFFTGLRPSDGAGYTVVEADPADLNDGRDTRGTVAGTAAGTATNDRFTGVVLGAGQHAENYNFGERPATTGLDLDDQAAGVGFWQNNRGQNLIKALNGGPAATQLGNWLAATFPNMYGSLAGRTNAQVAAHYKTLFARSASFLTGPAKTEAQVMATALAVYVTNETLAGTTAVSYGFRVTEYGLGARGMTLGDHCSAFGVSSGTVSISVLDLLFAVNSRSRNGLLFDNNGNGRIELGEAVGRTVAYLVFGLINEAGGI